MFIHRSVTSEVKLFSSLAPSVLSGSSFFYVVINSAMLPSLVMCSKILIFCSLTPFSSSFSVTYNIAKVKESTERKLPCF